MQETKFDQALKWVGVILLGIFAVFIAGLLLYWVYGEIDDKARHVLLVLVTLMLPIMYGLGESRGGAYRSGFEDAHTRAPLASNSAPQTSVYTPPQTVIDQDDRLPASYNAITPDLEARVIKAVQGSES